MALIADGSCAAGWGFRKSYRSGACCGEGSTSLHGAAIDRAGSSLRRWRLRRDLGLIERTTWREAERGDEKADWVQAIGINVQIMVMRPTEAGRLAAWRRLRRRVVQVSPSWVPRWWIVVFAVVVIGGMGYILGGIVAARCSADRRLDQGHYPEGHSKSLCSSSWPCPDLAAGPGITEE